MHLLDGTPERVPDRAALVAAMRHTPGALAIVRVPRPNHREHVYLLVSDDRQPGQVTVQIPTPKPTGQPGSTAAPPSPSTRPGCPAPRSPCSTATENQPHSRPWPPPTPPASRHPAPAPGHQPPRTRLDSLLDPPTGRPGAIGLEIELSNDRAALPCRALDTRYLVKSRPRPTVGGIPAPVLGITPEIAGPDIGTLPEIDGNPIQSLADEQGWHDEQTAFPELEDAIARLLGAPTDGRARRYRRSSRRRTRWTSRGEERRSGAGQGAGAMSSTCSGRWGFRCRACMNSSDGSPGNPAPGSVNGRRSLSSTSRMGWTSAPWWPGQPRGRAAWPPARRPERWVIPPRRWRATCRCCITTPPRRSPRSRRRAGQELGVRHIP